MAEAAPDSLGVVQPHDLLLAFSKSGHTEEIARFVSAVAPLGVNKIRLTGGEPLMRRNLARLDRGPGT